MSRSKKPLLDPPERLSEIERKRIRIWCHKNFPQYAKRLGRLWCECRDHYLKNGGQFVNWEAAFRSWVRMQEEIDGGRLANKGRNRSPAVGSLELPQELGLRSGEIGPLFEVIQGGSKK